MAKNKYIDKLKSTNLDSRHLLYKKFDNDYSIKTLYPGCYEGNTYFINELRSLIKIYIKENLEMSGIKVKKIDTNFINKYENQINKILTLSKNGAIYPKDETQLIYNLIVNYILKSIKNILPYIEKINYPTIRFKTKNKSSNGFSTDKLHSDGWSSGKTSDAVISFPILGDIKNNNVDFYKLNKVKKSFFSEKKNYDNTKNLYGKIKKIYNLKNSKWVIFDHSILHRTNAKDKCKPRVSVDMIVKIKKKEDKRNHVTKNFYSTQKFEKIGVKTFIKSMENYNQLLRRIKSKNRNKKFISQKLFTI